MAEVPLREGLFHIPGPSPDDHPYLIGTKCRLCGYTAFPPRHVCLKCLREETMEEVKLGPRGTLDSFAVMQVGPPDFRPPYVIGNIKIPEGPLVFALISGCEPRDDALELGQEMELTIECIKKDNQGNDLMAWKFRPARR